MLEPLTVGSLSSTSLLLQTLEHHASTRHCRVHFMEKKTMIVSSRQLPDNEFKGALKKKVSLNIFMRTVSFEPV